MGKADKGRPQQIPMSNKINPAAGQSKPKKNHKIYFFLFSAPLPHLHLCRVSRQSIAFVLTREKIRFIVLFD
jgi:hypothetical protein